MKLRQDLIYSYQRSTVFAHPVTTDHRQRLIAQSMPLDEWPIRTPGSKAAIRCLAWRHPIEGIFYLPVTQEEVA